MEPTAPSVPSRGVAQCGVRLEQGSEAGRCVGQP